MAKRPPLKDHPQEKQQFMKRALVISFLCLMFYGAIIARLYFLQVTEHDRYRNLSNQNQLELIPIKPTRGLIYDRNGVLLADNTPVFSLEVIPNRIKDFKALITQLRQYIAITDDDIADYKKQVAQHRPFEPVPLRLKLSDEERARFAVDQYKFPGVMVNAQLLRHYPMGAAFSHVLGYVGRINESELQKVDPINYSATNFIGKNGIERYYEPILHGHVGYERVEIDASGRTIQVMHRTPPVPGNNIYLTIDAQLEIAAEEALGTLRGAIVAIEPKTGQVLALVSNPGFDPNLFVRGISTKDYNTLKNDKQQPLYNRAIRGQYPFGSTIKPYMALEGLDSNMVDHSFTISDPGYYRLPGSSHVYKDWKKGGHGMVNLQRAIVVSCDIYFYTLANKMGISHIDNILHKFGFGMPTQIDLKEELPGLVPTPAWKQKNKHEVWYPGDTIISGIGQGFMQVTPLQMAQGVATIANRGKRIRPHLLLKQILPQGTEIPNPPINEFPVLLRDNQIWEYVIDAMHRVVTDAGGTGYHFGRDVTYPLAMKTGTAQVYSAKFHKDLDEDNLPEELRDNTLFIGFAPLDEPKIALAVMAENSKLASDVARKVMDFYLLPKATPVAAPKPTDEPQE